MVRFYPIGLVRKGALYVIEDSGSFQNFSAAWIIPPKPLELDPKFTGAL
jgi:hypothetical protein